MVPAKRRIFLLGVPKWERAPASTQIKAEGPSWTMALCIESPTSMTRAPRVLDNFVGKGRTVEGLCCNHVGGGGGRGQAFLLTHTHTRTSTHTHTLGSTRRIHSEGQQGLMRVAYKFKGLTPNGLQRKAVFTAPRLS